MPDQMQVVSLDNERRKRTRLTDDEHSKLVDWFEEAEESSYNARKLAQRDRDYYDNKQLTAEEIAELRKRGQPDIVINRIKTKINFLIGLEAQQRSDPKAFPRNPQDEEASEAATDALRYVEEKEDLDQHNSHVWKEMLIEGYSGVEVLHKRTKRGIEIDIKEWTFDRLFYDPHSTKHDFSDATYLGGVIWMDYEVAVQKWPNAEPILTATLQSSRLNSYEDRPSWRIWAQGGKRKRVRVAQMYWLDKGQWRWNTFTEGGELEGGQVPYLNEEGESECPMILQSAYVDRENNRYGEVRSMIGPQDEINARRSSLLHFATVRQFQYERGAVDDVDATKRELARRDGAVEINPGFNFGMIDNSIQVQGQAELLQEAKAEIDQQAANNALQGRAGSSASGRAIIASQQGGLIEVSPLTDRHRHFKQRVYRAIWNRIRQFWDEERWVRVTDDEDNLKFVGLNREITIAEAMLEGLEKDGVPKDQAIALINQKAAMDPNIAAQLQQTIRINVPADMDMDIIVKDAPDTINIQQEQFDQIAQMVQAGVPFPPDVIIGASSLRNKRELIEKLNQQQQTNPLMVQNMELELEQKRADIEETRTKSIKNLADADEKDVRQLQPPGQKQLPLDNVSPAP